MAQNKLCIVAINEGDFGSTGYVAKSILEYYKGKGSDVYLFCIKNKNKYSFTKSLSKGKIYDFVNRALCRFDASDGFHNKSATKDMLKTFDSIKPSIIHLNNVHGHYINLELLFQYCQSHDIQIVWTLHDCWAFTGKCPHFDMVNCEKWKNSCGNCPIKKEYPAAYLVDQSKKNLTRKTELINKYKDNITLVSPSKWLDDCVSRSHLKDVRHVVINNGIDLQAEIDNEFKSELIKKYNLENKTILFSAILGYSTKKGIEYINRLADELDTDKYAFLLAGLNDKEASRCSKSIISLGVISNRNQMNALYSISSAYLNPTMEDNFPTVNLESLVNGTPVITFETGGSPEMLNSKVGIVINKGDYQSLKSTVIDLSTRNFSKNDCFEQANKYSKENMCEQYSNLFSKLLLNK